MSNPELIGVPRHAYTAWITLHEQIAETPGGSPCAGPDRNDWTSNTRAVQKRAADRCLDCPALTACHAYARAAGERDGVWGGLTPSERHTAPGAQRTKRTPPKGQPR